MAAVDEVDAAGPAGRHEIARAARRRLLGVLEDEADLAAGELMRAEDPRCAEQHRGVAVVATGVHRAWVLRREVDAALLRDRERVDVRAQRDGRTRAAGGQAGEHAVLGRALDLQAIEALERPGDERGGLALLEARLGMAVQVPAPLDDLLLHALDPTPPPRRQSAAGRRRWAARRARARAARARPSTRRRCAPRRSRRRAASRRAHARAPP